MGEIRLWDDNPSAVDLLGFDAVVTPVLEAIGAPDLDPLTIGIHGPWGGGKSTVLGLVAGSLDTDSGYVVVRTDPWEYDDHLDVKGTLIAEVLGALDEYLADNAGFREKTKALLRRISWSRVGSALAKGAITMQWNPVDVVEAFTPKTKELPESMTGFRTAFEELLDGVPDLKRVVVLVDDLDRCLPEAVTATLEAIKLFLSVPKMVFVIAADQDMVRDAIAVSVDSATRGERFATRYLEKIIQLPVSLPRLAPYESEAYTALLLARAECPHDGDFDALVGHCRDRRRSHMHPLVAELGALPWQPDAELLLLAAQLAQGLGADKVANPREIKRFLNAFGVRRHIANARGIDVSPAVIGKLLLLEDRYRDDFELLAGTPEAERPDLLGRWEGWALGEEAHPTPPPGVSEATRGWAAAEPHLTGVELGPYITLAATLVSVAVGADLSDELSALMARLVGPSEADRGLAQQELASQPVTARRQVVAALLAQARRLEDVVAVVGALVGIAQRSPEVSDDVARGIREDAWRRLEPASVASLAASEDPLLAALVPEIAADLDLEADVREAARRVQEP